MVKSADKLAFITGNDKYLTGVEGSFPVLVKSVREEFCCFRYRHSYACLWREEQTISGKLDRHCRRDRGALIVIDTILIAKFSELEYLLDCSNWNTHHCMWFSDQVWRRPSFGTAGPPAPWGVITHWSPRRVITYLMWSLRLPSLILVRWWKTIAIKELNSAWIQATISWAKAV